MSIFEKVGFGKQKSEGLCPHQREPLGCDLCKKVEQKNQNEKAELSYKQDKEKRELEKTLEEKSRMSESEALIEANTIRGQKKMEEWKYGGKKATYPHVEKKVAKLLDEVEGGGRYTNIFPNDPREHLEHAMRTGEMLGLIENKMMELENLKKEIEKSPWMSGYSHNIDDNISKKLANVGIKLPHWRGAENKIDEEVDIMLKKKKGE